MERPDQRPRSKSTFSFKSDKSHGSRGKSVDKTNHFHSHSSHETPEQKRRSHLSPTGKADPNAAMNEVQPVAAALEKPTLQSLRSFQHTDRNGNPIAEPDLSNPTRSRWERPLDTIRSFEAAIDSEYKRRSHITRPDSEIQSAYASRRSSYYGAGAGNSYDQNRYSQYGNGYGNNRQVRDSYGEGSGYGYGGPVGGPKSRYNPNRMQSDPGFLNRQSVNGNNVYPTQAHMQSRDTVNTGGSGSQSDPYSNEQGSENSSIEQRGGPVARPDLGEQYGFNGFGGGGPQPILEEYGNNSGPNDGYFPPPQNNMPPPVPAKQAPQPSSAFSPNPIQLSNSNGQGPPQVTAGRPGTLRKNTGESEKRKSWFKKRFSKN
ncbi:hypothetical protein B0J11DRAFT_550556 [Dendryphion nanum]|uniref:Uncharacterized protein n=1 Tax=Dendryphion nanum TaxID=256645 RepID=A0A9P9DN37_9PLEO|nr:hypothetical protein B0J11DRAFT_550556 [Dendryphion nanum]